MNDLEEQKKIWLHADDFGMCPNATEKIMTCWENGYLDSVSLFPNGNYEDILHLIKKDRLKVRLHLNLVEGKCLSDPKELGLLVDEDGFFRYSFVGLLFLLLSKNRKEAEKQIGMEIEKQIQFFCELTNSKRIGIDSHQHAYMIPAIFRQLCESIEKQQIQLDSLRIPAEPILPFLKHPSLYKTYNPVNIVKNLLLNFFYVINYKRIKSMEIPQSIFMGIWFSGCMDEERIKKVLPDFKNIMKKRNCQLEILFHPGGIHKAEESLDKRKFAEFYLSPGRQIEAKTLLSAEFYHFVQGDRNKINGKTKNI